MGLVHSFKFVAILLCLILSAAGQHRNGKQHAKLHRHFAEEIEAVEPAATCAAIPDAVSSFQDLAAKVRASEEVCPNPGLQHLHLVKREEDDHSCSESKPCKNGACCSKTSGYCGYGPESCGTTGQSPNDVCWSNCDAHAECGRYAEDPGKECPLKVCCSQFGFCGMTEEFCAVTDNKNTSCQSNCEQPGSGGSGGDVQSRIIGYYEAWNYMKSCIGMRPQDIPVRSITHLHYAFGYVAPGSYEIVPMDDTPVRIFSEITAMKKQNPDLKILVSLGGWTFNDNGTATQPVFGEIAGSSGKRAKFISNLQSFMQQYGFDGVDLDWEYPGAPDRGGHDDDGKNYTQLMKDLRAALGKGLISFTAPTSYWYLRWFDLEAMMEYVDWVNVMSYDLHGIWDSTNPIGNHVLAHTNITEMKLALDLYWRNGIDPNKINLGLGFYGRSFQLSDPSCSTPGCLFKGGASPGPCSATSGVLTYREIMDIIKTNSLSPYYDKENQVKYITWGGDQWVSFDDKETFQAKIKFGNDLGLGGLLIWALDQDTADLDALAGVIYPKSLGEYGAEADSVNNWADAPGGDCRVTDCGVKGCSVGEIEIETNECSEPDFWDGSFMVNSLCCPLASAPDPKDCHWRGGGPFCNGRCHEGEVALESNKWGGVDDLDYCLDGLRFFCCGIPNLPKCHWTDCGVSCDTSKDNYMTWRYGSCATKQELCCDKDEEWKNCAWHGKPGSCFDNHCDTGHQVSLATSYEGAGDDCGIHLERERSFCCDPGDGKSPFLPVPLEYLFPNPPPEDTADTDFVLKVDPTYGGSVDVEFSDDPHDAAFGFVVMTSPEELQTSLDKRDGSHWDVFDCFDDTSEDEHTVRMVCTDYSEESNCHKIHLGLGVPGTIIEMPKGCGPGRYAVAKALEPSSNQQLPQRLIKRGMSSSDSVVYDLTFDYDFSRVPRDLGDTQVRIDYSNEPGYWDKVVDKAAKHKRKRDLDHHLRKRNKDYKRWLEDAWHEDKHMSGLSHDELHKRWFGSDVITWLKGLINGVTTGLNVANSFKDEYTLYLMKESWQCTISGVDLSANLDVKAETKVDVDTNFGLTILIPSLQNPDLKDSYLYFKQKGEITATFSIDALAQASFRAEKDLVPPIPLGAGFSIPGILTVGPQVKVAAVIEGAVTVHGYFESTVKIASWDVQQTFPDVNSDWNPKANDKPDVSGSKSDKTSTKYDVTADGHITAHVIPTVTFGISFKPSFLNINNCGVSLIADGHFTMHATASVSSKSFCYEGILGAEMYAAVEAPPIYGWKLPQAQYPIWSADPINVIPKTCPIGSARRDTAESYLELDAGYETVHDLDIYNSSQPGRTRRSLSKRGGVYGPPNVFLLKNLGCPGDSNGDESEPCPFCPDPTTSGSRLFLRDDDNSCVYEPGRTDENRCPASTSLRRDLDAAMTGNDTVLWDASEGHELVKRATKTLTWFYANGMKATPDLDVGGYPSCKKAADDGKVTKWYTFNGYDPKVPTCDTTFYKLNANQITTSDFETDHIYEAQLLTAFFKYVRGDYGTQIQLPPGYTAAGDDWVSGCVMGYPGFQFQPYAFDGADTLFVRLTQSIGGNGNEGDTMALLKDGVNGKKGVWFSLNSPATLAIGLRTTKITQRDGYGTFIYLRHPNILPKLTQTSKNIEAVLDDFDNTYPWANAPVTLPNPTPGGAALRGRIDKPNRANTGLRELYCYFIDRYMARIENNAAAWLTAARTDITTHFPTTQGNAWLNGALAANGDIGSGLHFDRPNAAWFPGSGVVQRSTYDMWDIRAAGPF